MSDPVLHIYSGNLFGGVETVLITLAGEECSHLPSEFALCFEGRLSTELRSRGASLHMLGPARLSRVDSILRARASLAKVLAARRYSAVICHAFWSWGIFGSVVRRSALPAICWVHDEPKWDHWMDRVSFLRLPDIAICNSRFVAGRLKQIWPGARTEVIYCPVSLAIPDRAARHRQLVRAELGTSENAAVIIQACRFEAWKGHLQNIMALKELGSDRNWEGWLVGDLQRESESAYLAEVRRAVRDFGLESRVRFLGQRSDVPRLLAAADIHCQPNTAAEPFGIVFVEALAAQLPVITTNLGAASEILDSTCAILVPPGRVGDLADALKRLVDNPLERARLGAAGPARAQLLSNPRAQASKLAAVLQSLPRAA
jgi:glycosyltransferase involved in cell wall biosynthesis